MKWLVEPQGRVYNMELDAAIVRQLAVPARYQWRDVMDAMVSEGMFRNGIDLERVAGLVEMIRADPALARFRFRARNRWVGGCENRSTVFDFDGLGDMRITRHKPFEFTNAEPPALLGQDESASALEFLLHALAGSITTTFVLRAAALGIAIESLFTEVEGEIDVRGMLGLEDAPPSGYEHIRVVIDVTANCTDETLDEMIEFARTHAPVCGALMRPVPVRVERTPSG